MSHHSATKASTGRDPPLLPASVFPYFAGGWSLALSCSFFLAVSFNFLFEQPAEPIQKGS